MDAPLGITAPVLWDQGGLGLPRQQSSQSRNLKPKPTPEFVVLTQSQANGLGVAQQKKKSTSVLLQWLFLCAALSQHLH